MTRVIGDDVGWYEQNGYEELSECKGHKQNRPVQQTKSRDGPILKLSLAIERL